MSPIERNHDEGQTPDDREIRDVLQPLSELRPSSEASERMLEAMRSAHRSGASRSRRNAPWWRRRVAIPAPIAALFAAAFLTLAGREVLIREKGDAAIKQTSEPPVSAVRRETPRPPRTPRIISITTYIPQVGVVSSQETQYYESEPTDHENDR